MKKIFEELNSKIKVVKEEEEEENVLFSLLILPKEQVP